MMTEGDIILRELFPKAVGINHVSDKLTPIASEEWSDTLLKSKARGLKFPKSGVSSLVNKAILIDRFGTFYLKGVTPPDLTVAQVVYGAITLARGRFNKDPIIRDNDMTNDHEAMFALKIPAWPKWSLTDTEVSQANIAHSTSGSMVFTLQKTRYKPPTNIPRIKGLLEETPVTQMTSKQGDPERLKRILVETIMSLKSGNETTKDILVESFVGYLALTFLRSAIKDANSLYIAFNKPQYHSTMTRLIQWTSDLPFCPPSEVAIRRAVVDLQKGTTFTTSLYTKLLGIYLDHVSSDAESDVTPILKETFLTSTAGNGLIPISLVGYVCKGFSVSWKTLARHTFYKGTQQSWELIAKFYERNVNESSPQYTFHWARIVNDAYYSYLSATENWFLCGILGVAVSELQGNQGIWSSAWAVKRAAELEYPRKFGIELVQILKRSHSNHGDTEFCRSEAAAHSGHREVVGTRRLSQAPIIAGPSADVLDAQSIIW